MICEPALALDPDVFAPVLAGSTQTPLPINLGGPRCTKGVRSLRLVEVSEGKATGRWLVLPVFVTLIDRKPALVTGWPAVASKASPNDAAWRDWDTEISIATTITNG